MTQTNNNNNLQQKVPALEDSSGIKNCDHEHAVPSHNMIKKNSSDTTEPTDSGLSDIEQYLDHGNIDTSSGEYCQSSNDQIPCGDTLSEDDSSLDVEMGINTLESSEKNASTVEIQLKNKDIIGTNKANSSNASYTATKDSVVLSNIMQTSCVSPAMCINNEDVNTMGIKDNKC